VPSLTTEKKFSPVPFPSSFFRFLLRSAVFSFLFPKKKRKSAEKRKKNKVKHYISPTCLPLKAGRLDAGGSLRSLE